MCKAYVYQAALLCKGCAITAREGHEPSDDSAHYPQGPYADGGGEADSPQHCDHCGEFLQNPLTGDGENYVRSALAAHGRGTPAVIAQWREFYAYLVEAQS
jgi:hypothetical protein